MCRENFTDIYSRKTFNMRQPCKVKNKNFFTISFDIITNSHNEKQYNYVHQIHMIYKPQNMLYEL